MRLSCSTAEDSEFCAVDFGTCPAGRDLGGRRQTFTGSQIRNALRLTEDGEPATQLARDLGTSLATLYRRVRELPQTKS